MNNVRNIIHPKKHNVWDVCYLSSRTVVSVDLRTNIWEIIVGDRDKFNQDVNLWFKINKI